MDVASIYGMFYVVSVLVSKIEYPNCYDLYVYVKKKKKV